MECPSCKNYFTLKEFCTETNPFKVKCPECEARLLYTNMKDIGKTIAKVALMILVAGYLISMLIPRPFDTIFLIWVVVACCVTGFYIVYQKADFVEMPEQEVDEAKDNKKV